MTLEQALELAQPNGAGVKMAMTTYGRLRVAVALEGHPVMVRVGNRLARGNDQGQGGQWEEVDQLPNCLDWMPL